MLPVLSVPRNMTPADVYRRVVFMESYLMQIKSGYTSLRQSCSTYLPKSMKTIEYQEFSSKELRPVGLKYNRDSEESKELPGCRPMVFRRTSSMPTWGSV